nr:putative ribonuclease H-like domain-containing protein [Tanacetum cinerariifolium]
MQEELLQFKIQNVWILVDCPKGALMHDKFQMSAMGELNFFLGLQVLQKKDGIFLSQDKYVGDILKKFGYSDVRHQVTPKECHLHAVKRIFRYLKGHPKLGLWYHKESPFDLVAYSDSDYGGATHYRKSTTGGCQFLGRRLISWQCKKQTTVATSTSEAEYVAVASGCGHVLWIQNQMLDYCLQRQQTLMAAKIKDQDLEIYGLKARVKFLKDKDRGSAMPTQKDAPIKGGIIELGEEVGAEKSTELRSNNTKEMINVLSSIEAANILTSGVAVVSVSPIVGVSIAGVPTVSGSFPTVSAIFTTASVVTTYTRRPRPRGIIIGGAQQIRSPIIRAKDKGKQKLVESERVSEQLVRDSEIARLHAKEELKRMIEGLDRSNEVIAKHLQEYEQAEVELIVGEKLELINELVKYQDHHAKILKYQAQQSRPLSKKEQMEFYMSVLRSHAGWKTRHFRVMTLEEIKEKFIPVWKQFEDFVPMSSKEEAERVKRKGLKEIHSEGKREEDLHQLWTLVKENLSIRHAIKDKEKELWVELKRLFEPDFKDQIWTHTQALMHDLLN